VALHGSEHKNWHANDRSAIWSQRAARPSGLGSPVGPRLAGSGQRLSLGGSGFIKADAWVAGIGAGKLASKEPVSHLEPARRSLPPASAAWRVPAGGLLAGSASI